MNVINACIDQNVKKVVALSTDKASNPINLYGATKPASDKLFIAANTNTLTVRASRSSAGNVMGSRFYRSVLPQQRQNGVAADYRSDHDTVHDHA